MYSNLGCASCATPTVTDACGRPIAQAEPTVPPHSHIWQLLAAFFVGYLVTRKS